MLAAHMGAGEPGIVADEVREQKPRLDPPLVGLAVDDHAQAALVASHSVPHPHRRIAAGPAG